MIVNPKKFQAIIMNRQNSSNRYCCLTISNAEIKSKELVTLLGIDIGNKLNFENHVSTISKWKWKQKEYMNYSSKMFKRRNTSNLERRVVKSGRIFIKASLLNPSNKSGKVSLSHYQQFSELDESPCSLNGNIII